MRSQLVITIQLLVSICFLGSSVFADGMPEGTEKAPSKGHKAPVEHIKQEPKRPSLSEIDLLPYQYCGKDSDCMQVINGCCQCVQGDLYVAINKDPLEAFQSRFSCNDVVCPKSEYVSYSCEDGVVTCLSHRCLHVAPGAGE